MDNFNIQQNIYFILSATFYCNTEHPHAASVCLMSILSDIMLSDVMLCVC
jgi:hypothetical protein